MQEQAQKICAGRLPTKDELDQLLLDLYHRIMRECEVWAATKPRDLEFRTYESSDDCYSDPEWVEHHDNSPEFRELDWWHALEDGHHDEAATYISAMLKERGLASCPFPCHRRGRHCESWRFKNRA